MLWEIKAAPLGVLLNRATIVIAYVSERGLTVGRRPSLRRTQMQD